MQRDLSPRGIKKFVGRAELADALGISTKTLGRMVNNGSFPRPIKVSPNRVGWPVSVVQQYYEARLMAVSVDDPAKLKPDEIEDAAVELSARLMTNVLGESVSPDNVMIGAVKQLSPDDADTATNSQWLALWLAVEDRMGADAGDGVLDGELEGSMAGSGVIHGDGPVSVISLAAVVAAVVPGSRWDGRAKANKKDDDNGCSAWLGAKLNPGLDDGAGCVGVQSPSQSSRRNTKCLMRRRSAAQ